MKVQQPTLADAEYAPGDTVRLRTGSTHYVVSFITLRLSGDAETGWEQHTGYVITPLMAPGSVEHSVTGAMLVLLDPFPDERPSLPRNASVEVDWFEPIASLPSTEPFEATNVSQVPEQLDSVW